jgi:hypothetical protein
MCLCSILSRWVSWFTSLGYMHFTYVYVCACLCIYTHGLWRTDGHHASLWRNRIWVQLTFLPTKPSLSYLRKRTCVCTHTHIRQFTHEFMFVHTDTQTHRHTHTEDSTYAYAPLSITCDRACPLQRIPIGKSTTVRRIPSEIGASRSRTRKRPYTTTAPSGNLLLQPTTA